MTATMGPDLIPGKGCHTQDQVDSSEFRTRHSCDVHVQQATLGPGGGQADSTTAMYPWIYGPTPLAHFTDKFGGVWRTCVVFAVGGPGMAFTAMLAMGLGNNWALITLIPISIVGCTSAFMCTLLPALPIGNGVMWQQVWSLSANHYILFLHQARAYHVRTCMDIKRMIEGFQTVR
jgi:hypothetical protein